MGYYEEEMTNHVWLLLMRELLLISLDISSMEHGSQFMLEWKLEIMRN